MPRKAINHRAFISSFYLYHNEERLEFIKGKHDIILEQKKEKEHMSKEVCWKLIYKTKDLHDEALLIFAYESGLRQNAIGHLTYGHYKNFMWFNNGQIAVFKVVSQPSKDYTFDKKLRGKGINWYFGCIHKEATTILKQYIAQYHQNSSDNTPLWRYKVHKTYWGVIKSCAKRAGFDPAKINFHALRRGFRGVVRNTPTIADSEFKEAIMGHKLRGSQENYFDKDPAEFAREYAKCDFSPSAEIVTEKEKEIQELKAKLEAIEKVKTEPPTPDPKPIDQPQPEPKQDDWYGKYLNDVSQGTPKPQPYERTPSCAKNCQFPTEQTCDGCQHNHYCNYSTSNTHFIGHEAI